MRLVPVTTQAPTLECLVGYSRMRHRTQVVGIMSMATVDTGLMDTMATDIMLATMITQGTSVPSRRITTLEATSVAVTTAPEDSMAAADTIE